MADVPSMTAAKSPFPVSVLVFTVEQGDAGKYGVAEAIVRVAADGRVLGIEKLRATNQRGDNYPRAAAAKEIETALATLARGT